MTQNPRTREGNHGGSLSPRCTYARRKAPSPELSKKTARLVGLYDDHLQVRYASTTAASYLDKLRIFLAWLDERGLEISSVRTEDVQAYVSDVLTRRKPDGRPYSVGAVINYIVAVRSFFQFLCRGGYVIHDPAAVLELPRQEDRLPRVILTRAEAKRLVSAPDGKARHGRRDRAILETLYGTGIRVGELVRLRLDDVDLEERVLRIVMGKGRKDRVVPLTRTAARAIEAYLAKERQQLIGARPRLELFLGGYGFPLRPASAGRIVHLWAKRARIKKPVSPHTFRHTVATHLLKNRADIRHIQVLLGHRSLATTQRYTRVEIADLKRVVERAHLRGR